MKVPQFFEALKTLCRSFFNASKNFGSLEIKTVVNVTQLVLVAAPAGLSRKKMKLVYNFNFPQGYIHMVVVVVPFKKQA